MPGPAGADDRGVELAVTRSGTARVIEWPLPALPTARDPVRDPRGGVYFAVPKGDRIARFDEKSHWFTLWDVPAGTKPHGVVLGPGHRVYFGGFGNGTINELDTASGSVRVLKRFGESSGIYSVAADRSGGLWFTDRKGSKVGRLNPADGTVSTWPMEGEPYGLVEGQDGRIWITRIAADKVGILDPATGRQEEVTFRPGAKPRRIAVAPDGRIWVTLFGIGKVATIDPVTRKVVREYDMPGSAISGPYSVSVDRRGRVWITLFQTDHVAILDPVANRIELITLPEKKSGIRNATLDADGRLWYLAGTSERLGVVQ